MLTETMLDSVMDAAGRDAADQVSNETCELFSDVWRVMVQQVGLNSPMSVSSSTKADYMKHVICMPNVGLPPFPSAASAHSGSADSASAPKVTTNPADCRSKQNEDESLHLWGMNDAAGMVAEQHSECDESVGCVLSEVPGAGGLYRAQQRKKDKEREYLSRILSEAMQRHLRANSPPSGNVLPPRILEMKDATRSDVDAAPHPLAAGTCTLHGLRHMTHDTTTGTLSWTQHGFIARAKVDKLKRKLLAKRKVTLKSVARDPRLPSSAAHGFGRGTDCRYDRQSLGHPRCVSR